MVALDPDALVDRRRIRRRLSLWRFLAILAIIAAAGAIAYGLSNEGLPFARKDHIAAVSIGGVITGRDSQVDLLKKIASSDAARAVMVRINSPGGTTAGAEVLYEQLRKVAEKKPVVAVMETVAASGGYIVALACDHVVARGNTITGSIGVLFQWARVDEALSSLGIDVESIKSGPFKAEPDLFGETSPGARAITEQMVKDSYEWFVGLVAERRPVNLDRARVLSDGRVYTGRQALEARLIDEIGGEDEAKQWLVDNKGIDAALKIVEWDAESSGGIGLGARVAGWILSGLGLPAEPPFGLGPAVESQRLDGLLSLWHPDLHR